MRRSSAKRANTDQLLGTRKEAVDSKAVHCLEANPMFCFTSIHACSDEVPFSNY